MTGGSQRRNTRVSFHARVNLSFPSRTFSDCETRDLSLRGVFVVGVTEPADGDSGTVELCLSGTSSRVCLLMEAKVARHEDDGIALTFTGMDPDSFFHLRNIVYYHADDADELEDFPFGGGE